MKLEVGMYIRTKYNDFCNEVAIRKIIEIAEEDNNSFYVDCYIIDILGDEQGKLQIEDVEKASFNIIDLIEVGDYVNGKEVIEIYQAGNKFKGSSMYSFREKTIELDNDNYETIPNDCLLTNEDIKSIVTHEQMEQISYKLGE